MTPAFADTRNLSVHTYSNAAAATRYNRCAVSRNATASAALGADADELEDDEGTATAELPCCDACAR